MKTYGTAVWKGGLRDGKGAISTHSGALKEYPYGFSSRFEGKSGTNPEELIFHSMVRANSIVGRSTRSPNGADLACATA